MAFDRWRPIFEQYLSSFQSLGFQVFQSDEYGLKLSNSACSISFGTERYDEDFIQCFFHYPNSTHQMHKHFSLGDIYRHSLMNGKPLPEIKSISGAAELVDKEFFFKSVLALLADCPALMKLNYPFMHEASF